MLNVTLVGDTRVIADLTAYPANLRRALERKVTLLSIELQNRVKNKLSGQVLNVKTGALRRSIQRKVVATATRVLGYVYSSGDVKYAAIHEFGGKTAAHEIVARKASALAFMMGGKLVFAKSVQHPGSTMPERSYLRSSLTEMRDRIIVGMKEAALEGLRK